MNGKTNSTKVTRSTRRNKSKKYPMCSKRNDNKSTTTEQKTTEDKSSSSSTAGRPEEIRILQLKVTLRYIVSPIWRRIQVRNNVDTFYNLHCYIQEAMGWDRNHSYQFTAFNKAKPDEEVEIVSAAVQEMSELCDTEVKLSEYLQAAEDFVIYVYDFENGWEHEVFVEKILPVPSSKAEYPRCVAGKRACPPDDCGGVCGYLHLLEVLKNPTHEEFQQFSKLYPEFNPESFDRRKVFRRDRIFVKFF